MKRQPPPDSKFGLRRIEEKTPKARRRRAILWMMIFVAAAMTPASFLGWVGFYRWLVEREPPVISLPLNYVGFGGTAQQFTFRIQDRLSGLRSVEVTLDQGGRTVQLFERDYSSGTLIDDPSFFVDAKALNIEPGSATIRLSANDRSLWRNRQTIEQQIILDYDAPKLEVVQLPQSVTSNTLSYGILRAVDNNPVRVEVEIDGRSFPAERIRSANLYLSLLSGAVDGAAKTTPIVCSAVDAVGNRTSVNANIEFRPAGSHKSLDIDLKFGEIKETMATLFERYRSQRRALNPEDSFDPPKGLDPAVMAKFLHTLAVEFGAFTDRLTQPFFKSTTPSIPWSRHFAKIPAQVKFLPSDNLNVTLDGLSSFSKKSEGYFIEAKNGAPVFALNAGHVVYTDILGPNGDSVIVDHGFGLYSIYSNLEQINVREGDDVERGEPIARVGRTGIFPQDGYQISFRVRNSIVRADELVDPNGVLGEILKASNSSAGSE